MWLPEAYTSDKELWIAPNNPHWNPAGNERFAQLLLTVVHTRGLLPALELEPHALVVAQLTASGHEVQPPGHPQVDQQRARRSTATLEVHHDVLGATPHARGTRAHDLAREGLLAPLAELRERNPEASDLYQTISELTDGQDAFGILRRHQSHTSMRTSMFRARAEATMGERFELEAFHDVVLGAGAVTLTVLRGRVEAWAAGS